MIRPLTVATFLLACGSGLYLYQSKHEVQLLDRTIERSVRETGALREQSRLLAAEWTMLNDPERLRQFSDTYLSLKTIAPSQFTSVADLGIRLPAPRTEVPPHGADEQEPIPLATDVIPQASEPAVSETDILPVPPMPAAPPPVVAASTHQIDSRTAAARSPVTDSQPRSVASEARQAEPRATRVADVRSEVRPPAAPPPRPIVLAAPRPLPVNAQAAGNPQVTSSPVSGSSLAPVSAPAPAPVPMQSRPTMVASSAPYTGSLLGMAHGSGSVPPPLPRPAPLNATYRSN